VKIEFIDRVIVAVPDLAKACEQWRRAGFGVAAEHLECDGLSVARLAAGGIEIDLCALDTDGVSNPLNDAVREASKRGCAMVGWIWGASGRESRAPVSNSSSITMPALTTNSTVEIELLNSGLAGVMTGVTDARLDFESRSRHLEDICGANPNTVEFLEHIVVMTPFLEDAIAANEAAGVPCKRIREAGKGVRQAFFKLEQTVIEIVGPSRERPGCWGLALMCRDIERSVEITRNSGLQVTSPKQAIQGGQIARIIEPLNGIAIAYMQPGERIDD